MGQRKNKPKNKKKKLQKELKKVILGESVSPEETLDDIDNILKKLLKL